MASGIISVGLSLTGHDLLSLVALAVAGALWLVLAADFATRLVGDRGRFRAEADTPPALNAVAATTVLGARLSQLGWQGAAALLLALAAALWPGLLYAVLRHWPRHRLPGTAFLVCVATQGLAVLAAELSDADHRTWLGRAALVCFALGLLLYAAALARFDLREVTGGAGDHWVAAWGAVHQRPRGFEAHRVTRVDGRRARRPALPHPGGPLRLPRLVRRAPDGRAAQPPPRLRHPPLVHRVPPRHDGHRLPLRRRTHRRGLAAPRG